MREVIVRARKDGRGGIKPFGKYTKRQWEKGKGGAWVEIGKKKYKVTSDGRVNIPKKIMNEFGVTGKDGRKRVAIDFASKQSTSKKGKESNYWKQLAATISTPGHDSKDASTGEFAFYDFDEHGEPVTNELIAESDGDYHWT